MGLLAKSIPGLLKHLQIRAQGTGSKIRYGVPWKLIDGGICTSELYKKLCFCPHPWVYECTAVWQTVNCMVEAHSYVGNTEEENNGYVVFK
jgi:hypothetical protein